MAGVGDHAGRERREPAVFEGNDTIGDIENAIVVSHQQDGAALAFRKVVNVFDHLASRCPIKRGCGFIGQNDLRFANEGAGDRHALLLPAGDLRRVVIDAIAQTDRFQDRDTFLPGLPPRHGISPTRP